jgi:23S rRNA pseudouridine2605 synthase
MENRKTERSRKESKGEAYGNRPARKSGVTEKVTRRTTRSADRPKRDDDEKFYHKDGGKPTGKGRATVNKKGAVTSRHDREEWHDKPERRERSERHSGYGRPESRDRRERSDRHERYDKPESRDRRERSDRHDRYSKPESRDRRERSDRHDRYGKPESRDRYGKHDKPERKERSKRSERLELSESVRLNKFIANSGICSRREADEYIKTGLVTVNGEIVTELGTKVKQDDDVRFNGQRLKGEKKVYLLMNKPKDYITTMSDPHAKKSVIDLISPEKCKERVVPVGRLDKATTGVLLFTNDGDLAARLTHPSYNVKKIYHVFLDKNLKKTDFDALLKGITLEDGEIHADSLSYVDDDMSQVGIEIHSGRNRIVRRMFEHLGYEIKKLDRVYFAGLTKNNLRRGAWRFLTEEEITYLKMGNFN